jgi:hypothetical protein
MSEHATTYCPDCTQLRADLDYNANMVAAIRELCLDPGKDGIKFSCIVEGQTVSVEPPAVIPILKAIEYRMRGFKAAGIVDAWERESKHLSQIKELRRVLRHCVRDLKTLAPQSQHYRDAQAVMDTFAFPEEFVAGGVVGDARPVPAGEAPPEHPDGSPFVPPKPNDGPYLPDDSGLVRLCDECCDRIRNESPYHLEVITLGNLHGGDCDGCGTFGAKDELSYVRKSLWATVP